jgi:3-dehydrosphinganine reductase
MTKQSAASNPSAQRFHYISNDLITAEGNKKTVEEATRWNNGRAPDIVWCVAGDSFPQFYLETDIDTLRWQMDINYWAATYMAHTILNAWLAPDSSSKGTERHFIATCSTTAFYPCPGYNTYSPAKAAMRNLIDGLAQEIKIYGENVQLHTIFPGNISSPGMDNENLLKPDITKTFDEEDPPQTPDEVARIAIKGLENGEQLVCTNFLGQAMRAQMWSGTRRNNWLLDSLLTFGTIFAWPFIRADLDGKVVKYGKQHGHPSNYVKRKP